MIYLGSLALPLRVVRGLGGRSGASWPALEVIEGKPKRQFLGPAGGELTLSLWLHASLIDPVQTRAALEVLASSGETFEVLTSDGQQLGTWVVESVDARVVWAPRGVPLVISCDVRLLDPGLERPLNVARPAALQAYARAVTTEGPTEDLSRDPGEVPLTEVTRS